MKKIFSTINALLLIITISYAQFEVKVNPIELIVNQLEVSVEYVITEKLGIEVSNAFYYGNAPLSGLTTAEKFEQGGYRLRLAAKYYFKPNIPGNKFYLGPYFGPRKEVVSGDIAQFGYDPGYELTAFSVGVLGGYKYLFKNGIILEFQGGIGYGFNSQISPNDPTLNVYVVELLEIEAVRSLSIGYRF